MTSGRSTDWFCIDAITGANPPPDFISSPILIQTKWEQGINASGYDEKREGEKHKREETGSENRRYVPVRSQQSP